MTADTTPAPPAPPEEAAGGTLLAARGLAKSFGPTTALQSASFDIDPGELVAVMGSSGSGKTTLLHCLAGITRPDHGWILYQGRDLAAMSESERSGLRRGEFGFLFQSGGLVPELSCLENAALPLRLNGTGRKVAHRRAEEWLEHLGVAHTARQQPGEVSGGEYQRVGMARALITDPAILFADEPTGALDSLNEEKVMRLLATSARSSGTAVVLVTHEPRIAAYADREVGVRDGRTRDFAAGAAG
ncbi:ABC transporter ATP-binding protein [Streptomonospora litoralis]|uniref:Lipoprotein-releasing system ATP-binding protein LolD n=1 Tax=Streptomonospora litoralis TaxID=2498135 RepID=A0A4P6Q6K0_9ACTN|nr:ABC transporter ATP-binding protein [Streptomonospora litoralis]QBI56355.1 Lipoprotein-releasing system ATP-binding protein LolD [Streptomonospora litoralis]